MGEGGADLLVKLMERNQADAAHQTNYFVRQWLLESARVSVIRDLVTGIIDSVGDRPNYDRLLTALESLEVALYPSDEVVDLIAARRQEEDHNYA